MIAEKKKELMEDKSISDNVYHTQSEEKEGSTMDRSTMQRPDDPDVRCSLSSLSEEWDVKNYKVRRNDTRYTNGPGTSSGPDNNINNNVNNNINNNIKTPPLTGV